MRTLLLSVACAAFFFVVSPVPSVVAAPTCTNGELMNGVCVPSSSATGLPDTAADVVVINIMNWLLGMLGLFAMIMFVVSGIMYLTAGGDEKQTEKAKNNMKYAIIGVAVALLGYTVLFTVQEVVSGTATGGTGASGTPTSATGVQY